MARIVGYSSDDTLYGTSGADVINGRGGEDRMFGGTGNDVYVVDTVGDEVTEYSAQGIDTVRTSVSYGLAAGSYVERLLTDDDAGTAAINLNGNELRNYIRGNAGDNVINGQDGNDVIDGGAGDDILLGGGGRDRVTGGLGADTFVVTDLSRDRYEDFQTGIDVIDLGWLLTQSEFTFIGSGGFSGTAGEGRFVNGYFQLDLDGNQFADLTIAVNGTVTASDFIFAAHGAWDY